MNGTSSLVTKSQRYEKLRIKAVTCEGGEFE